MCGWHANKQQVGQSGQLTLIIKHSDELFHCVDEDGEFGGFSFRGGSKGRSGRRSCGAMQDKACGIVDLF